MPTFSVMLYHSGVWDKAEALIVEARDAKEAAERACGSMLVEGEPKPWLLRAKVWPASNPAMKRIFSDPPRQGTRFLPLLGQFDFHWSQRLLLNAP